MWTGAKTQPPDADAPKYKCLQMAYPGEGWGSAVKAATCTMQKRGRPFLWQKSKKKRQGSKHSEIIFSIDMMHTITAKGTDGVEWQAREGIATSKGLLILIKLCGFICGNRKEKPLKPAGSDWFLQRNQRPALSFAATGVFHEYVSIAIQELHSLRPGIHDPIADSCRDCRVGAATSVIVVFCIANVAKEQNDDCLTTKHRRL